MNRLLVARLLAVSFGLALAALLAELYLRLAGATLAEPRLPLTYDLEAITQIETDQAYLVFDREIGWLPTPGHYRQAGRVSYRHNQHGLRADRDYPPAPPPQTRRLLAYGDSFTYCNGVDLEDCWTDQLARSLGNAEVLNFGVPGFGPDQAWLRYQRDGARWQGCAVVIAHQVENVNRAINRFRPFYNWDTGIPLAKPRYILDHGQPILLPSPATALSDLRDPAWVEANLGPHDAWYLPGTFVPNPLDSLELVRVTRTAAYQVSRRETVDWSLHGAELMYRPGQEPFEVLLAVLLGFAAQVRADGATPIVLVLPTREEIVGERSGRLRPHAPLVAALEQAGVPTLDPTRELANETQRVGLNRVVAGHYRPAGNAVVSRVLAERLPELSAATCGSSD